jgi:hypothetical protein
LRLPGVTVAAKWGQRTWMVGGRGFAWQRPFSKADLKRFGDETPPAGEILAVRVVSLDEEISKPADPPKRDRPYLGLGGAGLALCW